MNSTTRSLLFWMLLVVVVLAIWNLSSQFRAGDDDVAFSEFIRWVETGQVDRVELSGNEVTGTDSSGEQFRTYAPPQYEGLVNQLLERDVRLEAREAAGSPWATLLYSWAPILLVIGFWVFFMRQVQSGGNKALSFGKSRAKLSSSAQKKVTFKDVAGVDEPKEELQEIIEFLREPQKFQKLGGRIPKGVLLMGPPGTGKTLLARAVAGEANVPFFSISGSDFVEMFVGVGASRVRDLFEQGKKNAPCIVFIDEIDAVGRHRGAGLGGGHDEREQTLNQLLVEMDGFESNEGVILVSATNRPDVLDPALLRPGRFDRRIVVNRPDVKGREGIFGVHTRKIPLADDVDVHVLARGTSGFCGADIANLVNEAALNAARYNQKTVAMQDFEFAKDKVMMGSERRSLIISDEEKRVTAVHEAGHALLGVELEHADPVHKVTIIPRGMALGVTQQLPLDDKHNYSAEYLHDQLAVLLGGRIAEEITNTTVTTGAGNDLDRVTDLARRMVCEWGMSETVGPLTFGRKDEEIFLGRDFAQHKDYSEETAIRIDQEIKRIVTDNYERARSILEGKKNELLRIAEELLTREVLSGDQVQRIVAGQASKSRRLPPRLSSRTSPPARRRRGRRWCRRSASRCRRNSRIRRPASPSAGRQHPAASGRGSAPSIERQVFRRDLGVPVRVVEGIVRDAGSPLLHAAAARRPAARSRRADAGDGGRQRDPRLVLGRRPLAGPGTRGRPCPRAGSGRRRPARRRRRVDAARRRSGADGGGAAARRAGAGAAGRPGPGAVVRRHLQVGGRAGRRRGRRGDGQRRVGSAPRPGSRRRRRGERGRPRHHAQPRAFARHVPRRVLRRRRDRGGARAAGVDRGGGRGRRGPVADTRRPRPRLRQADGAVLGRPGRARPARGARPAHPRGAVAQVVSRRWRRRRTRGSRLGDRRRGDRGDSRRRPRGPGASGPGDAAGGRGRGPVPGRPRGPPGSLRGAARGPAPAELPRSV